MPSSLRRRKPESSHSRDIAQHGFQFCRPPRSDTLRMGACELMQALQLSKQQQEQLLLIRKNHLSELRALLIERQTLNMQVCPLT